MSNIVRLYSTNSDELNIFLNKFYEFPIHLKNSHYWENLYSNPIELADIVAAFIDNNDVYSQRLYLPEILWLILMSICGLVLILVFL